MPTEPVTDQNADCSLMGTAENARQVPIEHQPLRFTVRPPSTRSSRRYGDAFDVYLDGEFVVTSSQPFYDGARVLRSLGYADDTLLTMRHHNKLYDSFKPMAIGWLAQWTMSDSPKTGLARRKWQPMPEHLKGKRNEVRNQAARQDGMDR